VRMGGMALSLDCLVARPTFPHDSHLYPESKYSVATNFCRAVGTSVSELDGVGEALSLRRWE
jgi:hypothetical protein